MLLNQVPPHYKRMCVWCDFSCTTSVSPKPQPMSTTILLPSLLFPFDPRLVPDFFFLTLEIDSPCAEVDSIYLPQTLLDVGAKPKLF